MMRSRLEKKLADLRQKRDTLDQQLRLLESEKANELRKIRDKKARLIGLAILDTLTAGSPVQLTDEAALLAFMEPALLRKTDRDLFGLTETLPAPPAPTPDPPATGKQAGNHRRQKPAPALPKPDPVGVTEAIAVPPAAKANPRKRKLRESAGADLLAEFDL